MALTGFATQMLSALWLRLLCRVILATILYYAVMRLAGAQILKECQQFFLNKLNPHKI